MEDSKPYFLFPRKQSVSQAIVNKNQREVVTLNYKNNFFSYLDESSSDKLDPKLLNYG